jgi:hypothetical protein
VPGTTKIAWTSAEDDYLKSRNLSLTDPAMTKTPEARAYLDEQAARKLKAALERALAKRPPGSRPVRLVATINEVMIPSAAQRVLIGGMPTVRADIDIVDARTGAVLSTFKGAQGSQYAGQGIGGVVVDAALVAGGADDLYDRAANNYAGRFTDWLAATH